MDDNPQEQVSLTNRSVFPSETRVKKPTKHFVRLSGSYSLEVHPNGQPVALPTLTGLRDAHAQTVF